MNCSNSMIQIPVQTAVNYYDWKFIVATIWLKRIYSVHPIHMFVLIYWANRIVQSSIHCIRKRKRKHWIHAGTKNSLFVYCQPVTKYWWKFLMKIALHVMISLAKWILHWIIFQQKRPIWLSNHNDIHCNSEVKNPKFEAILRYIMPILMHRQHRQHIPLLHWMLVKNRSMIMTMYVFNDCSNVSPIWFHSFIHSSNSKTSGKLSTNQGPTISIMTGQEAKKIYRMDGKNDKIQMDVLIMSIIILALHNGHDHPPSTINGLLVSIYLYFPLFSNTRPLSATSSTSDAQTSSSNIGGDAIDQQTPSPSTVNQQQQQAFYRRFHVGSSMDQSLPSQSQSSSISSLSSATYDNNLNEQNSQHHSINQNQVFRLTCIVYLFISLFLHVPYTRTEFIEFR